MKIKRSKSKSKSLYISGTGYIQKDLERFRISESRPVAMPLEKQILHKQSQDQPDVNQFETKEGIGSLHYAAMISQPDIIYAARKLASYAEKQSLIQWVRVK